MITPADALRRAECALEPHGLFTAGQVAAVVGMDPGTVYRAMVAGTLPADYEGPLRAYGFQVHEWLKARCAKVRPGTGVLAVARTGNAKLGDAAVTLVARQSCPDTCAFKEKGCYAEHDNNRVFWDRLTAGAVDASPLALARAEAAAIDGLPGDRDLRLHVAGDSATVEGTELIAAACARYAERGRAKGLSVVAWGYTHAWRVVPRAAWGPVSILASCETAEDVLDARARGYAAALVVPAFDAESAYPLVGGDGAKVLPCPQQTRDRTCTECRLCFAPDRLLRANLAIGFSLHGGGSNKARAALAKRTPLPMAA